LLSDSFARIARVGWPDAAPSPTYPRGTCVRPLGPAAAGVLQVNSTTSYGALATLFRILLGGLFRAADVIPHRLEHLLDIGNAERFFMRTLYFLRAPICRPAISSRLMALDSAWRAYPSRRPWRPPEGAIVLRDMRYRRAGWKLGIPAQCREPVSVLKPGGNCGGSAALQSGQDVPTAPQPYASSPSHRLVRMRKPTKQKR
jgi:hypothetical protein